MDEFSAREAVRIREYYNEHPERERLQDPSGKLEFERSKEIIRRHIARPLSVLDVGGGTGAYSFWLAALGHRVTFLDLSNVHVETVRQLDAQGGAKLAAILEGSVLALPFADLSFDAVLNMGPLYHLPPDLRHAALAEIRRVLRPDGFMVTAYISRFAALMDGYREDFVADPAFEALALGDIRHGRHDGPPHGRYFTVAYMHRPEEVAPELEKAGFEVREVCAVEGFWWTFPNLAAYTSDAGRFAQLLGHARLVEKEPSVMGASAHLLAVSVVRKDP
jgi:SAM-dependent methyltransferase